MGKKVIVVGAGILGAAAALYLSRAGAEVTVYEAEESVGGLATAASFAWINASWGNPAPYARLRRRAMAEWRVLEPNVPWLEQNVCGGLLWDLPEDELRAFVATEADEGYAIRLCDADEAARIEPALRTAPALAAHAADEAMIEPVAAARAMLAASGARILRGTWVLRLLRSGGAVVGVETTQGFSDADEVVLTTGIGTPELLVTIGADLPMRSPPGLLAVTQPLPPLLNGLVLSPGLHLRQTHEGRLVAGSDFGGADPGANAKAVAERLIASARALLNGADAAILDHYSLGRRPTPDDGFPAVGRPKQMPGLYVCTSHSGVTLAPALGRMLADEIMTGARDPLLALYHPDRFLVKP